nr:DUF1661 domain-containing protein [Porphyromonas gulae]
MGKRNSGIATLLRLSRHIYQTNIRVSEQYPVDRIKTVHAPKISYSTVRKTWLEKFFVLVRKVKILRATTKKFSRLFFRILRPQSEHFPFAFSRQQIS